MRNSLHYAKAPELEAAWRYIQADFRVALSRRNRLIEGKVGFWELMRSGSFQKLLKEAEAEVDRLHDMLKAIDNVRAAVINESAEPTNENELDMLAEA